ncbi:MAG: histidine phosphatase family protein [Steroidobacteraceae bacterium]|jgi:probable phosphoglycerate mutase
MGPSAVVDQVYLIRHGQTSWSVSGQHTGRTDVPLTEQGEQQARQLGVVLHAVSFSQVLVSPMQRARRTCELAGLGAQARIEPLLHEWDYGDYEGLTRAQIRATRAQWDVFRDGCPGGESPEQVSARAAQILLQVRAMPGRVALFSHGHLLRALGVRWIELPIQAGSHFGLDAGSLSVLGYEHASALEPAIELWNATGLRGDA